MAASPGQPRPVRNMRIDTSPARRFCQAHAHSDDAVRESRPHGEHEKEVCPMTADTKTEIREMLGNGTGVL